MKSKNNKFLIFLILLFVCGINGCKKLVEIDAPYTSINAQNVYNTDATAAAVLTGIYSKISVNNAGLSSEGDLGSFSLLLSLSADELTLFNKDNLNLYYFYTNALTSISPSPSSGFWTNIYSYIFIANSAIEGISNNTLLTANVQRQLLGEAKFIRAYCYFYLVNLYGDVPLVLSTDPLKNATLSRTSSDLVYKQVILDLKDAYDLLGSNYVAGDATSETTERLRPTKWSAAALLARTYLYTKDYINAEARASLVINQSSLYQLTSLENVFLKNSMEAIWQIQPVSVKTNANTGEGQIFILPSTGPDRDQYPVYLSDSLIGTFENQDQRLVKWVDSVNTTSGDYYYSYKYKVGANNPDGLISEYLMIFRLGEQYLIRAEARAQLGNISDAQSDLNAIRKRAGLNNTSASTQSELLSAILHERQVELFTEGGHRWLDLKRTNKIDEVMNVVEPIKGGTWNSNWQLYPIPLQELKSDPNLVQNPGYTN